MTDKEKLDAIRAEIHRLVDVRGYDRGMANDLFAFMDSLPNEPVSNDLEAEFVLYLKRKFNIPQEGHKLKTNGWKPNPYDILDIAKHFAQWQKKQEAKEVDLEKEIHYAADQYDINNNGNIYWEDIVGFAKHFFELGLKAQKGE